MADFATLLRTARAFRSQGEINQLAHNPNPAPLYTPENVDVAAHDVAWVYFADQEKALDYALLLIAAYERGVAAAASIK